MIKSKFEWQSRASRGLRLLVGNYYLEWETNSVVICITCGSKLLTVYGLKIKMSQEANGGLDASALSISLVWPGPKASPV